MWQCNKVHFGSSEIGSEMLAFGSTHISAPQTAVVERIIAKLLSFSKHDFAVVETH